MQRHLSAHLQQVVSVELQLEAAQVGVLDHVSVQRIKAGLVVVLKCAAGKITTDNMS
jgi:hypothetical protein